MAQKKVKTRIQNKYDTFTNWSSADNFKPLPGELIVYQQSSRQPLVKIGNGATLVNDLPFLGVPSMAYAEPELVEFTSHIADNRTFFVSGPTEQGTVVLECHVGVGDDDYFLEGHPANGFVKKQTVYVPFSRGQAAATCDADLLVTILLVGHPEEGYTVQSPSAQCALVYLEPSKCLVNNWSVSNTVSDSTYEGPSMTYAAEEINYTPSSVGDFQYKVFLPNDKNAAGDFKFNSGLLAIEFDILKLDDVDLIVNIKNTVSLRVEE